MERVCGANGDKVVQMNAQQLSDAKRALGNYFTKVSVPAPVELRRYSRWLAEFDALDYSAGDDSLWLELPGQYAGWARPLPGRQARLTGCSPQVRVMVSLRKPKAITLRTNDERECRVLVKAGEDLRQDQRLQQLFGLMNRALCVEPATRRRCLRLRTYQVSPLTSKVGLLEWMASTTTLRDLLMSEASASEWKAVDLAKQDLNNVFMKGVPGGVKSLPSKVVHSYAIHGHMTERALAAAEKRLPWNLLRRAYQAHAASQESFFALRQEAVRSHGALCAAHYLLGVGDRHLSNLMVCLRTGALIGIDFGYAFGTSVSMLPVPELVPFRLTCQLRGLMEPAGARHGTFGAALSATLETLRKRQDLLISAMRVFIQDVSQDWRQLARRLRRQEKGGTDENDGIEDAEQDDWFAKEKIMAAQGRICGDHPVKLLLADLHLNKAVHQHLEHITEKLRGEQQRPRAHLLKEERLSIDQLTDVLVDMATDPALLSRMWIHWDPFV